MPEFKDIGKASKDLFKKVNSQNTVPHRVQYHTEYSAIQTCFSHSTLENWTLISRLEVSAWATLLPINSLQNWKEKILMPSKVLSQDSPYHTRPFWMATMSKWKCQSHLPWIKTLSMLTTTQATILPRVSFSPMFPVENSLKTLRHLKMYFRFHLPHNQDEIRWCWLWFHRRYRNLR